MKISVITIVRNAEHYVDRTIQSMLAQTYPDIEYLVIDGASTDGTLEKIRAYESRITKIVSEPDKGISDAWNKGLRMATGDVIGLLNAGDEHAPDAAAKVATAMRAGADVVFGDTELVDDEGRVLMFNRGRFHPWFYSAGFGMYHPSVFVRRSVYEKVGDFNPSYRYAMDSDWLSRAYVAGAKFEHSGSLTRMVDGGISVQRRFAAYGEHLQAMHSAGMPRSFVYRSMLMTGLRGLARLARPRQG
jgi:glycosyltransferase involved in cell wall biosynthesis